MSDNVADQLNILVVDDESASLNLIVDIVTRENHQAVPASSAEEILKLLPFWTFQAAFIDHHLPGMDGMVLGEYLRRNNPNMTIAIVTGAPDNALFRRSQELGLEFIAKPFGVSEILHVVDTYRQKSFERENERWHQQDDEFVPMIAKYSELLSDYFDIPGVPSRIEGRLVETIKHSINNLRSLHRYNERDRVVALAGLLAARVLGVRLPKTQSNRSLYEEYDNLMSERGRRREFSS